MLVPRPSYFLLTADGWDLLFTHYCIPREIENARAILEYFNLFLDIAFSVKWIGSMIGLRDKLKPIASPSDLKK